VFGNPLLKPSSINNPATKGNWQRRPSTMRKLSIMRKRTTLVCATSAIALTLGLPSLAARAADATVVSVPQCDINGGAVTVPGGQPITLHLGGYAEGTPGLIKVVLHSQTTTLQAGDTTYDLSNQWSSPVYNPTSNLWVIAQPNRLLGTITAGQTVVVTYDISFSHPVAILFPPVGPSGFNGPFVITEEGPFVCAITAV
jgi:hypothetical protein